MDRFVAINSLSTQEKMQLTAAMIEHDQVILAAEIRKLTILKQFLENSVLNKLATARRGKVCTAISLLIFGSMFTATVAARSARAAAIDELHHTLIPQQNNISCFDHFKVSQGDCNQKLALENECTHACELLMLSVKFFVTFLLADTLYVAPLCVFIYFQVLYIQNLTAEIDRINTKKLENLPTSVKAEIRKHPALTMEMTVAEALAITVHDIEKYQAHVKNIPAQIKQLLEKMSEEHLGIPLLNQRTSAIKEYHSFSI